MFNDQKRFHFDLKDMKKMIGPYYLYQIGDMNFFGDYIIEEHVQFVYEVTYVVSGQAQVRIRDKWYTGKQGNVFLHRMNDIHEMRGEKGKEFRFFYLGLDFKDEKDPVACQMKRLFDEPGNVLLEEVSGIRDAFLRLLNENRSTDSFTDKMTESHINEILVRIYRAFERKVYEEYPVEWQKRTNENLVYDVVNYIDLNLFSIDKLTDLSTVFGYSYSSIAKRFSAIMGESLQGYFLRRKYDQAREWLQQGVSVTEVAERMGYQSVHAFSRAFHHRTGIAPSVYSNWIEESKKNG